MPKQIKILYIHHGGFNGGAPRSLAFLINELDKEQFDPIVVCHHDFEDNKRLFESVGAEVIHGKYIGGWYGSTVSPINKNILQYNIKHIIPSYFGIKKIIRKTHPDIIHLNSTCLCFVARSIKRSFPEIPIVCHVREPLLEGFWGNILRRNCEKAVDRYIAIEQFDADSLHTKKKTEIIHNFVDFNIYNDQLSSSCLREELGLEDNQKILLYLARVCPENGALEFVNAVKSFLSRRTDIQLCIVGVNPGDTSEYVNALKQCATQYCNIHLIGFRNDVPQVIASSDIMIVPFQVPHFARSIIEAAAMGVPSIASDIGGVNELILDGKTGYLLNSSTFSGFDTICERLIDNQIEYNRVSQNAIVHARTYFDSKTNAQRTFLIYKELLK